MTINPMEEWTKFKKAFAESLKKAGKEKLTEAWASVVNKTAFYNDIVRNIAESTSYKLEYEKFRCDYALLNHGNIPMAFIEAENNHPTAWQEISNLCCLTSPLKVLILSCEWIESEKVKFLPQWREIIKKHHSYLPFDCIYAIIVGEWGMNDDNLWHFYYTAMDGQAEIICDDSFTAEI